MNQPNKLDSEQIAKEFLSGYKLRSERFSKEQLQSIKTPDFKVYKNDDLIFYCEVKNTEKDTWLDKRLELVAPGEFAGDVRNDPIFNRLSAHIHKAGKQFDAVNPNLDFTNVLVFYNQDRKSGFLDLIAVVTGNFLAEGGESFPIYKNFSEGRIKEDIQKIHLFIWLDAFKPHRFLFNTTNVNYRNILCPVFNYDPNNLKIVPS
jgi:hypothetical protein